MTTTEQHRADPVTIAELAADVGFHTDCVNLIGDQDAKPWNTTANDDRKAEIAVRTRCRVAGCSVGYALGGVCGYCRAKVRMMRVKTGQG